MKLYLDGCSSWASTARRGALVAASALAMFTSGCDDASTTTSTGMGGSGGSGSSSAAGMTTSSSSASTGDTTTGATTTTTSSTSTGMGGICGDGTVDPGEDCDDSNMMSGDGCSSTCKVECAPDAFIECQGTDAIYCNATGDGTTPFDCGAGGCISGMGLTGCGQCTMDTCTSGMPSTFVTCDPAHGAIVASGDCATLAAGGATSECNGAVCAQCTGAHVCGDGTNGTVAGSSYDCSMGAVGAATPCAFGCDAATGQCSDIVAASQAQAHLQAGDTFTCTGTQSMNLGTIDAPAGATVNVNTTTHVVTVNGAQVMGLRWGNAYTPTGSGTPSVVLHAKSVTIAEGVSVRVTGTAALVLVVDQGVTANGTAMMPTVIDVSSKTNVDAGPGAPSSTAGGTGGLASNNGSGGGGGAGHFTGGGVGGGGNNVTTGGGMAGGTYSVAMMTEILQAGENGGNGAGAAIGNLNGGNGGGALQITACGTITMTANVVVNASGGGGRGGAKAIAAIQSGAGGGGGGSGGTILLEASTFVIGGSLVANGGGGGGGGGTSAGQTGTDGENWGTNMIAATPPSTAAKGGTSPGVVANPGIGGDGGAVAAAGMNGQSAGANIGGGAGGGGLGVIFLNVPQGAAAPTVGASSPAIETSTICSTVNGAPPMGGCMYP